MGSSAARGLPLFCRWYQPRLMQESESEPEPRPVQEPEPGPVQEPEPGPVQELETVQDSKPGPVQEPEMLMQEYDTELVQETGPMHESVQELVPDKLLKLLDAASGPASQDLR